MDKAEAIKRIKDHIRVHKIGEYPHIKLAEALSMAISALAADNNVGDKWFPVTERLPEPETEVLVLAVRKCYSFKTKSQVIHHIVLTGMYEDGSKNTEDSAWCWYEHDFKYDEELDAYIIPEGWWEYKHYNGDDEHNHPIEDRVTHWMPLPEAPKEG